MPHPSPLGEFRPEVRRPLRFLLAFRLASNTGVRFAYSFLPALSAGTGLSPAALGWVLLARDLSGVAAPTVGHLAHRRGTVRLMTAGAALATTAYLVAALGPVGLVVGLVLSGFGKVVFDVAMNAWVADEVAYERRGRASGLVEVTWAGAALVGLPLCGLLISGVGWWAAPAAIGGFALVVAVGLFRVRPDAGVGAGSVGPSTGWLRPDRQVVAAMVAFGAMTASSQFLLVGHGLWFDGTYGFDATRIGVAVVAIGTIEAVASFGSAGLTDRLGKRPSILAGLALLVVACVALVARPAPPVALGLVLLIAAFLGFEFAFVSSLPLNAELVPSARAQVVGLSIGVSTAVRAVGSPVGVYLFERGFAVLMAGAVVGGVVAIVLYAVVVGEPVPASPEPEPEPESPGRGTAGPQRSTRTGPRDPGSGSK